jgi:hypothetical protein
MPQSEHTAQPPQQPKKQKRSTQRWPKLQNTVRATAQTKTWERQATPRPSRYTSPRPLPAPINHICTGPTACKWPKLHATARPRTTQATRSQKAGTWQCVPMDRQTKEKNSHRRFTSPRLLPAPIIPHLHQQITRAFAHSTLFGSETSP